MDMLVGQDWLRARAAATPNAVALLEGANVWRWDELDTAVDRHASGLLLEGVKPGSRVACLLPNNANFVLTLFAMARAGAVFVPLNSRLLPAEMVGLLESSGCEWLLHDNQTAAMAQAVLAVLPNVSGLCLPLGEAGAPGGAGFDKEAVQSIIFTSGTSGVPKGACLTYGNLFANAHGSAAHLGTGPSDRWLACLPLYHVGGMTILWRACLNGFGVILQDGFQEEAVVRATDTQAATLVSLVPTMLKRLLEWPGGTEALARLRLVLLGGAAADPELLQAARAAGIRVAVTYGLTEATSQVATARPEELPARPATVGRPLPGVQVRIGLEQGGPVVPDRIGEVLVSGPTVMAGYDGLPEATDAALQDGWLHTGDLGWMDAEGYVYILQRRSDLIVSGGENVYPVEVEAVLVRHPAVQAACVIGLPDSEWGQRVAAAVVLRPGMAVTPADLDQYCRDEMASYKRPREYFYMKSLPLTASGKIMRRAVAEMLSLRSAVAQGDLA